MKRYTVQFDREARIEAIAAADYIAADSPNMAARWYTGLTKVITSLAILPHRCGKAREAKTLSRDLRQYIYKSYRIIFQIEEPERIVRILHIRHVAMRPLPPA